MDEPTLALGLTAAQIDALGAHWTAREIAQQPRVWPDVARLVADDSGLAGFLASALASPQQRVLFAGAGTSSFVGDCLAPSLASKGQLRADAVASTDIVAGPDSWLAPDVPTLVVHFARSGSSPESVATMDLAEQRIERCAHLIVTCNAQGALFKRASAMRHAHTLLLPEASHDQSFAMTSSFTGMLLAAAVALRAVPGDEARISHLAGLANQVMVAHLPVMNELARGRFERVVFLGSNELRGLARESALKMLELTDGQVMAMADSTLGFRHGPKTALNHSALVVVYLSNDAHTRQYDLDLLAELRADGVAGRVVALTNRGNVPAHRDTLVVGGAASSAASARSGANAADALSDLELCLPYVVFAQSLAMLCSLSRGISPDRPNAAGTVHRVVQGVSIYPYNRRR
jgi:tagatose-6-phosphate ketose/aldose isomerase